MHSSVLRLQVLRSIALSHTGGCVLFVMVMKCDPPEGGADAWLPY